MKLAVVSMIRDEADILPAFLRHVSAVFDAAYLFDHRSADGSGEMLRQFCARRGFSYFLLDFAGRHQRQVSMLGMERAFAAGADAVVFLDADEFLEPSRAEIEAAVQQLDAAGAVGTLGWIPCYPQTFAAAFDPQVPMWIAKSAANVSKVVIPRSVYERAGGQVPLAEGNHFVEWSGRDRVPQRHIGHLYHVPLRSRQQAVRKALIGAIAHLAKANSMQLEGYQQRELVDLVAASRLDDASLASMARTYAEAPHGGLDAPREFALHPLDVALSAESIRSVADAADLCVVAGALRGVQFELHDQPALQIAGHVVSVDPRQRAAGIHELQAAFARQTDQLGSIRFLALRLAKLLSLRAMRVVGALSRLAARNAPRSAGKPALIPHRQRAA